MAVILPRSVVLKRLISSTISVGSVRLWKPPLIDNGQKLLGQLCQFLIVGGLGRLQGQRIARLVLLDELEQLRRVGIGLENRLGIALGEIETADLGIVQEIVPVAGECLVGGSGATHRAGACVDSARNRFQ